MTLASRLILAPCCNMRPEAEAAADPTGAADPNAAHQTDIIEMQARLLDEKIGLVPWILLQPLCPPLHLRPLHSYSISPPDAFAPCLHVYVQAAPQY